MEHQFLFLAVAQWSDAEELQQDCLLQWQYGLLVLRKVLGLYVVLIVQYR